MFSPDYLRPLITIFVLFLLSSLESVIPAAGGRTHRSRHAIKNLALGLFNAGVLALLTAPFAARLASWNENSGSGLLPLLNLSPVNSTVLAILMLDAWMYVWHRANHRIAFLWRFHRLHHSDAEMDATTAVRFHLGELLISTSLRLLVMLALGIALWQWLAYEMLLLPVILFHHSNVYFPARLDQWLRTIIVSPALHRVHHSRVKIETDSNYASVFSWWDRLGKSYRLNKDNHPIIFGLDEKAGEEWRPAIEGS